MSKAKRNEKESTNQLLGVFVTPTEKKMVAAAKPDEVSMSEFLRGLIMPPVKRILILKDEKKKD